MPWTALIIAFAVGALVSVPRARSIKNGHPDASFLLCVVRAATPLPLILLILIGLLAGYCYATLPSYGENGAAIAVFYLAVFGLPIILALLTGGILGSALVFRYRRP